MPTPRPATTLILSIADTFTEMEKLLQASNSWNVYKYKGSNFRKLFAQIPELKLPCAVLAYEGSRYYLDPEVANRRIHVIVAVRETKNPFADGFEGATTLAEQAITLLDQQILNNSHAVLFVVDDNQFDLGETIAAIDVLFEVKDN